MFRGLDNVEHPLFIGVSAPDASDPQPFQYAYNAVTPGNGQGITATIAGGNGGSCSSNCPINGVPPVTVTDQNGTVYQFGYMGAGIGNVTQFMQYRYGEAASSITDRNGNQIKGGVGGYTDTLGRQLISWTGIGNNGDTVTVAGLGGPITLHRANVPETFPETMQNLGPGNCTLAGANYSTVPAITEIDLPNGQKWKFSYDATYGRISQIGFPGGGYVSYTWGLNQASTATAFAGVRVPDYSDPQDTYTSDACTVTYDTPAVTDRYVSHDGSHVVLHQHFAYSTTWDGKSDGYWTSKTTTVTTTDSVANQSWTTIYHYGYVTEPIVPFSQTSLVPQVPVESSVVHEDGSGNVLRTLYQTWNNERELAGQQTVLDNGQASAQLYCYDGNEERTEGDEFDYQRYGAAGAAPSCFATTSAALPGGWGPLRRRTATAYHNFVGASPSTHIMDEPDSVTVFDELGATAAQTTFAYDAGSPAASGDIQLTSPPGLRGNTTSISRWAGGSHWLTTNYTWLDSGQLASMADPAGDTTKFSYADSWRSGSAPGQTGAYLTKVQYPDTSSPNLAHHIETFSWDYGTGELATRTGQNGNRTTFTYNDPLGRLTAISYPDIGATSVVYNDTPGSISVEVRKLISGGSWTDAFTYFDGMGHVVTRCTANGLTLPWDRADTVWDGAGRKAAQSYPYEAGDCNAANGGQPGDAFAHDALNRPTSVTHSDGSTIATVYGGAATEVEDEGNGSHRVARMSQTDGLGRLVGVCEESGSAQKGTDSAPSGCGLDLGGSAFSTGFLITYSYDTLDNLTDVHQGPNLADRTFAYDPASRLLTAANPESGTIQYTYDVAACGAPAQAGQLTCKSDARGATIGFVYDQLNRVRQKIHGVPGGVAATAEATLDYDEASALGQALANTDGRLSSERTADGRTAEAFSYDRRGRVAGDWQCAPSGSSGCTTYSLPYFYNPLGLPTSWASGTGVTYSAAYNGVAQLRGLTSSLSDGQHPATLLSGVAYNDAFGLESAAMLGNLVAEQRVYDVRGRLTSLSEGGTPVPPIPAKPGTGWVSIGGGEQTTQYCYPVYGGEQCQTIYDGGAVIVNVNGNSHGGGWGQGSTPSTVAASLAAGFNGDSTSPVTAAAAGGTVSFTSKAGGAATNYPLSVGEQWNQQHFSSPSFTGTASGPALTGGADAQPGNPTGALYSLSVNYARDGDVAAATDSVNGAWRYSFDEFNRLSAASCASGCPGGQSALGLAWSYDRYGNRWTQTATAGSAPQPSATFTGGSNRRDGAAYDAAGDLVGDGDGNSYGYDAEGRIATDGASVGYLYDASGRRAAKIVNGAMTSFLYDLGGRAVNEITAGGSLRSEVFALGRHWATYYGGTTYFDHGDWLGTERARTAYTGSQAPTALAESCTSLPYGDGLACSGADASDLHFTGKERDSESGLDYFGARYNASSMGRFMSPDPLGGHLFDPQTLNKYIYARDNPLRFTDPTGLDLEAQCSRESATCHKQHWWSRHRYVGTFDQHHHFEITRFQTDQNGSLAGHTVNFDSTGPHIDNNRAEFIAGTPATRVNGTGAFDGMHAVFNSNCGGTCAAGGLLFGTRAQFQRILNNHSLVGPNPGLDAIDFFHPGTMQFRGGNTEGPDAHLSFTTARDPFRLGDPFHIDTRYPYGSIGGFLEHTGGVFQTFGNILIGRHGPPLPDNIPATAVPQ